MKDNEILNEVELFKPLEEECGNCKFCITRKGRLNKEKEFLSYNCHRYPIERQLSKNHWCGEWKSRNINIW